METESRPFASGGHKRKWCYTLKEIAELSGVSIHAVRQARKRGVLDPASLQSVLEYLAGRGLRVRKERTASISPLPAPEREDWLDKEIPTKGEKR